MGHHAGTDYVNQHDLHPYAWPTTQARGHARSWTPCGATSNLSPRQAALQQLVHDETRGDENKIGERKLLLYSSSDALWHEFVTGPMKTCGLPEESIMFRTMAVHKVENGKGIHFSRSPNRQCYRAADADHGLGRRALTSDGSVERHLGRVNGAASISQQAPYVRNHGAHPLRSSARSFTSPGGMPGSSRRRKYRPNPKAPDR